jgi:hypothetical protein
VSADIVFVDSYLCPGCRVELEAGPRARQGWMRCPACGCPSLPPAPAAPPTPPLFNHRPSGPADVLFISESGSRPLKDVALEPTDERPSRFTPGRLMITTGLAFSLFMALLAYLDNRGMNLALFGVMSIVFFITLLRPVARRRPSS